MIIPGKSTSVVFGFDPCGSRYSEEYKLSFFSIQSQCIQYAYKHWRFRYKLIGLIVIVPKIFLVMFF